MRRLRGFRDLIFDAVEETTNLVERTHASVARKSILRFAQVEPVATPVRALQTARGQTAADVYATIRAVNRLVRTLADLGAGAIAGEAPAEREPAGLATPLRSDAAGSLGWLVDHVEGVLNGFLGDHLSRRRNGLDLGMTFRDHGRVLPVELEALARAFPDATGKLVVFVHGLSCTEWSWSLFAERYYGDPAVNFGSLLAADLGYTPLYIRYNAGRHVSENGRRLARLVSLLVAAYPREVDEVVLVGHSMGGLVVRSAAHYAHAQNEPWAGRLRHVFCLGAPNLGAPLEKAVNVLTGVLRSFDTPGTQVPAQILDARSAGVKDLRFGYTVDEEWKGKNPDAVLEDNRQDVPLVGGVGYYFLAAAITRDPDHPLGQVLGDLMVRLPSATGLARETARRISFCSGRIFGGMHHFHLANHPDVYDVIRRCIEAADLPAAAS